MTARAITVSFELSKVDGYFLLYARFRDGEVHQTIEIGPDLSADVDREGRVLGVEVVKTFPLDSPKGGIRFDIHEVQREVEQRFNCRMDEEFQAIRDATQAVV